MESNPNVAVYCRLRKADYTYLTIDPDHTHLTVDTSQITPETSPSSKSKQKTFVLNKVFLEEDSQQVVYDTSCAPLIDNFLKGYNCAIMAYGGTGSGKTYTMMGTPITNPGLIPRTMSQIWDYMKREPKIPNISVTVSIIEIYMEKVYDLLSVTKGTSLQIVTQGDIMTVKDAKEEPFTDLKTINRKLDIAFGNRVKVSTKMNTDSSRSHAVVIVRCRQSAMTPRSQSAASVTESTLYLVDLAGAEKQSDTESTGLTQQQGAAINKSLSALTQVMESLYKKSNYIPYRNSKLTWLMSKALGGNSKTSIIITCNPVLKQIDTVLRSLQFGDRARSMSNNAEISVGTISGSNSMDWKAKYLMTSAQLEAHTNLIADLQAKLLEISSANTTGTNTKDEAEEENEEEDDASIHPITDSTSVSASSSSSDILLKTDEEKKNLDSNHEHSSTVSFSRRSSGSSSRRPSVLATVLEDSDKLHLQDLLEKEIVIAPPPPIESREILPDNGDDSDSDSSLPALVLTEETLRRLTRPSVIAVPTIADLMKLNMQQQQQMLEQEKQRVQILQEEKQRLLQEKQEREEQKERQQQLLQEQRLMKSEETTSQIANELKQGFDQVKQNISDMNRLMIVPAENTLQTIGAPIQVEDQSWKNDMARMYEDIGKFYEDKEQLEQKVCELEQRLGISRITDEEVDNPTSLEDRHKKAHYPVTTWGLVCFYISLVVAIIGIAMIIRSHMKKGKKRSMVEMGGSWATFLGALAFIIACLYD